MELLRSGLKDLGTVFADGLRTLAAHWPQLVGLFLIGASLRAGVLWAAVEISNDNSLAAVLVLPLAPLATLLSLIIMVRVTASSLPAFQQVFAELTAKERWTSNLRVAAQVALPFLAVYATAGLLKEDTYTWLFDAGYSDAYNEVVPDYGAGNYAEGWALVALIVGALVIRKLITTFELTRKSLAVAIFAVYLEVMWMITFAKAFTTQLDDLIKWITTRRLIAGLYQWWQGLIEALGPLAALVTTPVQWIGEVVSSMGDLVIVPVAWLAVGATIYGTELSADGAEIPTHEDLSKRIERVPNPVRRALAQVTEPVTTPIKETWEAIRKVAAAGVVPMVLFCLVFVIAGQLKVAVAWLGRLLIGPRDPLLLYSLEPVVLLAERLVYFTVTIALVAAAVNRIVVSRTGLAAPSVPDAAAPVS